VRATVRRSIGSRRIPLHDHSDLNSGGKIGFSQAIVGGLEIITGSVPPATGGGTASTANTTVPLTMGTAVTIDVTQGDWFTGTLTANCAITVTGFAEDTGKVVIVELGQDGTGGWDLTWDSDVEFASSSQPTQAANTTTFFLLFTSAGDATIYGAQVGVGGGTLDDLTDVTITSATLDDDLRYNGSAWVNDARKWEVVTNGEDVLVWDGDDLVFEWNA
jgi:hypothetical protein